MKRKLQILASSTLGCKPYKERTLQQKLYLGTLLAMVVVLIPNLVMNYFLDINNIGNFITLFVSIPILLLLYLIGRCYHYYSPLIVGLGILLYLTLMWQNSSRGLYGTLPLMYVGALLATVSISKPKLHLYIFLVYLAHFLSMIVLDEFILNKNIIKYDSELTHNIDLIISYALTFLFSFWILRYYMVAYLNQHKVLKEQNAELSQANAMKNMYFTIMIHDLKGSFNNILGFSDLMSDPDGGYSVEQLQKMSKLTNVSARASFELLEDILELSRIQQNKIQLKVDRLNLKLSVEEIVKKVEVNAQHKEIIINNQLINDTLIQSDKYYIDTLLRNFINNALKFTPKEGAVSISVKNYKQDRLIVSVSDTGIGMESAWVDKLFNDDFKSMRLGTEGEPSTGIGLKICKELALKSGNEIFVESTLGKGSTFSFTVLKG